MTFCDQKSIDHDRRQIVQVLLKRPNIIVFTFNYYLPQFALGLCQLYWASVYISPQTIGDSIHLWQINKTWAYNLLKTKFLSIFLRNMEPGWRYEPRCRNRILLERLNWEGTSCKIRFLLKTGNELQNNCSDKLRSN